MAMSGRALPGLDGGGQSQVPRLPVRLAALSSTGMRRSQSVPPESWSSFNTPTFRTPRGHLNLKLPANHHRLGAGGLSGFTLQENSYVSRCLDKASQRGQSSGGSVNAVVRLRSNKDDKDERAQFGRTMSEIDALKRQHALAFSLQSDAKLLDAENPSAAAASKTPKETAEAYEERMRRTAEEKADFLARQAEYRLNTMQPHERIKMKLELFREDSRARQHLEERGAEFQAERARRDDQLNLVKRNRRAVRSMSVSHLSTAEAFFNGDGRRRVSVEQRVADAHARKQRFEAGEDPAGYQRRRAERLAGRAEEVRQCGERWRVLHVLNVSTAVFGAEIARGRAERGGVEDMAARMLAEQGGRLVMRRRLTGLRRSVIVLRRHVHFFIAGLRERIRCRAADRLKLYLEARIEAARVTKAIRNLVRKVVVMQRAWRRYLVCMEALHAVTVRQLDRVVRTKKRVESFLSPEAYKEYFRRVAPKVALATEGKREPGSQAKPKWQGKKGAIADALFDAEGELMQELALDGGRVLAIDVDTRDAVLSEFLRAGRREHMKRVRAWQEARTAVLSEFEGMRDMEAARRMATGGPEAGQAGLSSVQQAALRAKLPPHPRRVVLFQPSKLTALITDIIVRIGDKITAGQPIDGTRSVKRAAVRAVA